MTSAFLTPGASQADLRSPASPNHNTDRRGVMATVRSRPRIKIGVYGTAAMTRRYPAGRTAAYCRIPIWRVGYRFC